ncbi:MAG: hypothetical protein ACXW5U_11980 [Thermoanaerobaculia bacterium]
MFCHEHQREYVLGGECPICGIKSASHDAGRTAVAAATLGAAHVASRIDIAADRIAGAISDAADSIVGAQWATTEAIQETNGLIREAMEQQHRLAKESWRLVAQSKMERGLELLEAGLPERALATLQEAVEGANADRGNLAASVLLGRAYEETGQRDKALGALRDAVKLLGMREYSEPAHFIQVLRSLPSALFPTVESDFTTRIARAQLTHRDAPRLLQHVAMARYRGAVDAIADSIDEDLVNDGTLAALDANGFSDAGARIAHRAADVALYRGDAARWSAAFVYVAIRDRWRARRLYEGLADHNVPIDRLDVFLRAAIEAIRGKAASEARALLREVFEQRKSDLAAFYQQRAADDVHRKTERRDAALSEQVKRQAMIGCLVLFVVMVALFLCLLIASYRNAIAEATADRILIAGFGVGIAAIIARIVVTALRRGQEAPLSPNDEATRECQALEAAIAG